MKKTPIIGLAAVSVMLLSACGSTENPTDTGSTPIVESTIATETTEATTESKTAEDALDPDEHKMFSMLVDFSYNMINPSSLRLALWREGTVSYISDSEYCALKLNEGDTFTYIYVIGENSMGGNGETFAYIENGKLVSSSEKALSWMILKNEKEYNRDSINKINVALKEYFESVGY